ncbi:MAG TPA: M48 family metallopeptidase [Pyrinomonadaceae bacterium]|jgi:Zn-dependent protease with chaperone function
MSRFQLSLACLLFIFLPGCMSLRAQTTATTPRATSSPAEKRGGVQAYTLPPEKYEQAIVFSRTRWALHFIGVAYSLVLLLALLALKVAPLFRNWAEAVSRRRFVQALVFVPLLLLTFDLLHLPLDIYRQHLQLRYNQSIESWGGWFWDWTKSELIGLVTGTLLVWLMYAVIRRKARGWWFYFWLASLPILIFIFFITPVVIDPLFFKFEPLEARQPQLVSEIERLVKRGGLSISRERMFEMNASEKYTTLNAYVTGFGATKRVVMWDTTLKQMTMPQTLFVFGHEMGHYVLEHIFKAIAILSLMLLVLLFILARVVGWAISRWGTRWRIRGLDDWASLPVLMLFFLLFAFLGEPVGNTFSRYQEHEADVYALEVTHGIVPDSARAGAEAFQILGEKALSHPNPPAFIKVWLYSHPPVAERLKFARDYDPWSKGEQTQYVSRQ